MHYFLIGVYTLLFIASAYMVHDAFKRQLAKWMMTGILLLFVCSGIIGIQVCELVIEATHAH